MFFRASCQVAICALVALAAPAYGRQTVAIRTIDAAQTCTYFEESEGSAVAAQSTAAVIGRRGVAVASSSLYASSWRTWIVKDCQDNFPNLRRSLEAALASSAQLMIGEGGFYIDISVSDVSEDGPARASPVRGSNDYSISRSEALVTVSYTVYDGNGRSVTGGNFTKRIDTSIQANTASLRLKTSEPSEATYDLIQQAFSQAFAREIASYVNPAVVTKVDGQSIEINYGSPLVEIGTLLNVERTDGIGVVRYVVSAASQGRSIAEVDGDNSTAGIKVGSRVTLIEKGSEAENGRRYKRSRLP